MSDAKISFVSLGCPKALVDSEQIITQLRAEGYGITNHNQDADLVVINTCGFIDAAIEESLNEIGEAIRSNGNVIVTGCLGAKGDIVKQTYPNVLAVTGPHALQGVMTEVHKALPPKHDPFVSLVPPQGIKLTPKHYAYLKISEGCNHRCTFCIIPSLRGDLDSRSVNNVLDEAQNLVNAGVKELLVISQDTSAYGVDVKYKSEFWRGKPVKTQFQSLVHTLAELDVWVRLHYVYPYPHVDEVLPIMAEGRILPYLDIPFQHASPTILKAMKRPASAENVLQRIRQWRDVCPEIIIRSTFIVGFPGETDQDFEQLLSFINEAQLDRVGCFKYSAVEGAKANALENPVDEEIKQQRLEQFMQTQAVVSQQKLKNRIGYQYQMLIDDVSESTIVGRSYAEAPEIDGSILVDISSRPDLELNVGDFVDVEITGCNEHDLFADIIDS